LSPAFKYEKANGEDMFQIYPIAACTVFPNYASQVRWYDRPIFSCTVDSFSYNCAKSCPTCCNHVIMRPVSKLHQHFYLCFRVNLNWKDYCVIDW